MNVRKASGLDGIPPIFRVSVFRAGVSSHSTLLSKPKTNIFLGDGSLHMIQPISKKNSRSERSNHHPLVITCIKSKVI